MYFWNDKINNNGMFDGQNWIIDLKCVQRRFIERTIIQVHGIPALPGQLEKQNR